MFHYYALINFVELYFILIYFCLIFYLNTKAKGRRQKKYEKIIEFENIQNITQSEMQEFRKINSENILIDKVKYKKVKNPNISVIVTNYNQDHCIYKCLRSIQNQSIKNLEIIVKFITIIDGDDSFIHKNILFNSLYISKIGNLDIVEFRCSVFQNGIYRGNLYDYESFNITNIIYQPELRTKFFYIKENDAMRGILCRNICVKLIRNRILKKALINIVKNTQMIILWNMKIQ